MQTWIREHNQQVKLTGKGVRILPFRLPTKSPWLNPIEPKWVHGKRAIVETIDLQLQSRQAYWNVKGPHFMALRELFDQVAQGVEEYANLIAERIVQLGGKAEGTAHAVAGRSSLDGYRLSTSYGNSHIAALLTTLTDFGRHTRSASAQASQLMDADTAAIFTEIGRGIDKWLWFVETSQQAGS